MQLFSYRCCGNDYCNDIEDNYYYNSCELPILMKKVWSPNQGFAT